MLKSSSKHTSLSDDRLQQLLLGSSRTFALAIPLLAPAMRREVTVAYLLFRIADTFEDAGRLWPQGKRIDVLAEFADLLARPSRDRAVELTSEWMSDPPSSHAGYLELLADTPQVLDSWRALESEARDSIGEHTRRTARLMARFVKQTDEDGVLRLEGMEDLRSYCYAVAGIVGEMLTDLFLLGSPTLVDRAEYLRQRAADFGEGLQLVNILKDSAGDADEGRNFLPPTVNRSTVFELARADLDRAAEYVLEIQAGGGPAGVVAFTALPVELAWATLERVEHDGPGSKISRATVFKIHGRVQRAIAEGEPVVETGRAPKYTH